MTYIVSTIKRNDDGEILDIKKVGAFSNKIKAMEAAKDLAIGATDCHTYGPSSLAYYGTELTAVVAWD